jgi:hypothetical protein
MECGPDFTECNRHLDELIALSAACGLDLFSFIRLLCEAGAPALCAQVNDIFAISAGQRVVRYPLSDGLKVVLSALRARNIHTHKIKSRSGVRRVLSKTAASR